MGIFNRAKNQAGNEPGASEMRVRALVVDADAPPHGASRFGDFSHGDIRILVDFGAGPMQVAGKFRYAEEHWLVRGMDVDVFINPAEPQRFEVDWANVPPMTQRVAASDPTLVDPLGTGRRVAHALGLTKADTGTSRADAFAAAMEKAATTQAPPGRVRAVVMVATIRGRVETGGDDDGPSTTTVTVSRNSAAVLAVNVPGRAPYAVYLPKFKFPKMQRDIVGGGMPALVSATDPTDIEVLWAEMPDMWSQVADRMAGSAALSQQRAARATATHAVAVQAAIHAHAEAFAAQAAAAEAAAAANHPPGAYPPGAYPPGAYPPGAYPPGGPAGSVVTGSPATSAGAFAAIPPAMRQVAVANARRALQSIPDARMRQVMIDQYRSMGIELEHGE